jgi:hypothetical protein
MIPLDRVLGGAGPASWWSWTSGLVELQRRHVDVTSRGVTCCRFRRHGCDVDGGW